MATLLFSAIAVALLVAASDGELDIATVWLLKIAYGALVAAVVTPIALRVALAE
jgi:hypothetical protein